jgi:hypothetical protein
MWPHAALLALGCTAIGCGGRLGSAPLVITEVPNRPSGEALIARGAERSGCKVTRRPGERLLVSCPEGEVDVPTIPGPPTFAVRCLDARLQDVARCDALVRKMLLATEEGSAR